MTPELTLKRALYITFTGYGPCSDFTLAEWLEARDFFRANQEVALKSIGLPTTPMK
jgi:hypothetical protein